MSINTQRRQGYDVSSELISGEPVILQLHKATTYRVDPVVDPGGPARIQMNLLTGDYFISGQSTGGHTPYITGTLKEAADMARIINHWERTGKKKKNFKGSRKYLVEMTVTEASEERRTQRDELCSKSCS